MKKLLWAVIVLAHQCLAGDIPTKLVVSAGKFDRKDTVVSFAMPKGLDANVLIDEKGNGASWDVDENRIAWFVLKELKAGESKTYSFETHKIEMAEHSVRAEKTGGVVNVSINGKAVLSYQGDKTKLPEGFEPHYQRGGYIHPVFSPSGKLVTDDYAPNHKHHHGIWWAWTKSEFEGRHINFWDQAAKNAAVEFVALDKTWNGYVQCGFVARQRHVDLSAPGSKVVLNESWQVRVFNANPKYRVFDLVATQECASESALTHEKYLYGGLGVRGNREWNQKNADLFLTSEGKDRSNGNETRAKWCRMSGKVDGELCSITVIDHPSNFRAPQPMRLNPQEPFFAYAPSQLGEFKIEPGKPYVGRYRFVVADGESDAKELERLWNDFAEPPSVEFK